MRPLLTIVICLLLSTTAWAEHHEGTFAAPIEKAHNLEVWRSKPALRADITLEYMGNTVLDGTMTFDTPVGKSRIEGRDGTVMVFDGQDAWVAPADAAVPPGRARFGLLTWPYFTAAPFKLNDPGAHLEDHGDMPLTPELTMPTARLTFGDNVGDTPDDWYVVYRDPETDRLAALAYIVTYGKTMDEAEQEPHVARYEAFQTVDGVVVPTRVSLWNWSADAGIFGDRLGVFELKNIEFVDPAADTFIRPDGARKDALPEPNNED